jgi:flagellar basal-body rod protein FlgB
VEYRWLTELRRRNADFVESVTLASVNTARYPLRLPVAPGLQEHGSMLNGLAGKLEQYLDLLSARQKLVASNIANADTPGYKTQDIDFQTEFQNAAAGMGPHVVEANGLPVRNDGNNVSIDRESRLLAENDLRFNIASNLMRDKIRILKEAINGGNGS